MKIFLPNQSKECKWSNDFFFHRHISPLLHHLLFLTTRQLARDLRREHLNNTILLTALTGDPKTSSSRLENYSATWEQTLIWYM